MLIAHKIALDPNNAQATYLARAAGTARFAYNWALAEWKRQYEAWKQDNSRLKPSQAALRRQLNAVKRAQFPWMLEVTKNAPQMAIIQLGPSVPEFLRGTRGLTAIPQKRRSRPLHAHQRPVRHRRFTHPHPPSWLGTDARDVALQGQDPVGHGLPCGRQVVRLPRCRYPGHFALAQGRKPRRGRCGSGCQGVGDALDERRSPARRLTRRCWSDCSGCPAVRVARSRDRAIGARRGRSWHGCMPASLRSARMPCTSSRPLSPAGFTPSASRI